MKPNILLIRLDAAQRRPFFSKSMTIENIRKIIRDGISFSSSYSVSTISHPSQTSIDTGVFPHKHGIFGNQTPVPISMTMAKGIELLPGFLRREGYLTGKAGQGPANDINYDVDLTIPYAEFSDGLKDKGYTEETEPEKSYKYCGSLPYGVEDTRDGVYGENAIRIINRFSRKNSPWFVYLTFDGPHPPCKVSPPFDTIHLPSDVDIPLNWNTGIEGKPEHYRFFKRRMNMEGDLNENDVRILVAYYQGFLEMIDEIVGWVLDRLENLNLYSNTMIIFTSDHGAMTGNFGIAYHGGPQLCEDNISVPFFLCYPEKFCGGQTVGEFTSTVDILPTILEVCGIKPPSYLDGHSVIPLIEKNSCEWRKSIFFEWTSDGRSFYTIRGVRDSNFKFIYSPFGSWEIYDMKNDPWEKSNLGEEALDENKKMKEEMLGWMEITDDAILESAQKDLA